MTEHVPKHTRHKLLMELKDATGSNPHTVVKLVELAKKADITYDQARFCFIWLLEELFAKGNWTNNGKDANVQITIKGCDEAERLEAPFWKRWLTNETVILTVVVSLLAAVLGAALGAFLTPMFTKLFQ
jgi:hypothetical protein